MPSDIIELTGLITVDQASLFIKRFEWEEFLTTLSVIILVLSYYFESWLCLKISGNFVLFSHREICDALILSIRGVLMAICAQLIYPFCSLRD